MPQPKRFRARVSQRLIILVALLLCLIFPFNGFAQRKSHSFQELIEMLQSHDTKVRANAVQKFVTADGAKEAVPALITILKNNADAGVRGSAAYILGTIGEEATE